MESERQRASERERERERDRERERAKERERQARARSHDGPGLKPRWENPSTAQGPSIRGLSAPPAQCEDLVQGYLFHKKHFPPRTLQ